MEKPKRKDLSFWIGVAVAVVVVDLALVVGAIFLLKSKGETATGEVTTAPGSRPAATTPQPRVTTTTSQGTTVSNAAGFNWQIGGTRVDGPGGTTVNTNLTENMNIRTTGRTTTTINGGPEGTTDTSPKTYPWQVSRNQPGILNNTPPQVKIVPTEFASGGGGWSSRQGERAIGIRQAADQVILTAYKVNIRDRSRVVWPDGMPTGQYDYIANLQTGALEALQQEAKEKLGLTGSRETRDVPALVLKVNHADAPGLKPGTLAPGAGTTPAAQGTTRLRHAAMSALANSLEITTQMPVLDQTGLTEFYDIEFPRIQPAPRGQKFDRLEELQKIMLEQLGLDVVQTNATVELLVVKKVN
jgi:uncharacterized protein (TIGR03435 family)